MSNEPTKPESSIGLTLSGTPEDGQHVTMKDEKALEVIFGTEHPELADGLLRHCFKVLQPIESSDDFNGNDERAFMIATVSVNHPTHVWHPF